MTTASPAGDGEGEEAYLPFGRPSENQSTRREESDAAFRRAERVRARETVMSLLRERPMTCDEVMAATGLPHQTASATVNWLMRDGTIVATGEKRVTQHMREARVWRFVHDPAQRVRIGTDRPTRRQLEKRVDAAIKRLTESETTTRTEIVRILNGELK